MKEKSRSNLIGFIFGLFFVIVFTMVAIILTVYDEPSHPYVRIVHTIENGIIVKADTIVYFE